MTLEVETENDGRYADVDEERLRALVETLGDTNSYVILQRADRPGQYAQAAVARTPRGKVRAGFVVEYREGSAAHYQSDAADHADVVASLSGWAFASDDGWRDRVEWRVLDLGF